MKWRSRLAFGASFAGARALQFLAPVVAANFLSVADYGAVEWAHAASTLMSSLLSLGTTAVIPFVMLQADSRGSLAAVFLHQSVLAIILIGGTLALTPFVGLTTPIVVTGLFCAVLGLQGLWTYVLRSRGLDTLSLFLEASPFTLVAVASAICWLAAPLWGLHAVVATLLVAGLVLLLPTLGAFQKQRPSSPAGLLYAQTLHAGMPLMLSSLLTLLASTSGRLGIGLVGGTEATGSYSAIARVAALPVVAHQLAVVARFRALYSVTPEELERLMLQICIFVSACVSLYLLLLPWTGNLLGPAFHHASQTHRLAAVLLPVQAILWSGVALNDLLAARVSVLGRMLPWSASALVLSLGLSFYVLSMAGVSVDLFVILHTGVLMVLFVVQASLMYQAGVRFTRFWALCIGSFLILSAAGIALQSQWR